MTTHTVVGYVASIEGAEATVLLDAGAYDRVGLGDMRRHLSERGWFESTELAPPEFYASR